MLKKLAKMVKFGGALKAPPTLLGTYYAIGDIHGHAEKLHQLLAKITADSATRTGPVTLLCLGDYLNRGPASAEVIRTLRHELPSTWQTVFLRGNHEDELLNFIQKPAMHSQWLGWGGAETCQSYGVKPYGANGLRAPEALAAELAHAMNETGDLDWLAATKLYHLAGPYAFVHAGVRPGLAMQHQQSNDLLFIREDWLHTPHGLPYTVVFGHTIFPQPLVLADKIGLDTGAFQGGPLTAACLTANQSVTFIQAS